MATAALLVVGVVIVNALRGEASTSLEIDTPALREAPPPAPTFQILEKDDQLINKTAPGAGERNARLAELFLPRKEPQPDRR